MWGNGPGREQAGQRSGRELQQPPGALPAVHRAARLAAFVALAPALALTGCLAGAGADVEVVPFLDLQGAAPGSPTEFALALRASRDTALPVSFVDAPDGWLVQPDSDRVAVGPAGAVLVVAVEPARDASYGLHYASIKVGPREVFLAVDVRDAGEERLRPGIGALVRTVGFWDNGTVFYTNMKEVRDNRALRFGDLGGEPPTEADWEPLKVYVGGERGVPPPEPYNASGYRPVIAGFDARLRGMREGETLAVRIAPEDAYTRPGNEDHALYGDALGFVVQVTRVDDLGPAPECGLPVCPP